MARPGLQQHRKFRRLARSLNSVVMARGALEMLWDHCYESGDDYVGTSEDIESVVGWTGERGVLTKSLAEAGAPEGHGFIEPVGATPADATAWQCYRVHDLWHHAPDYVRKRRERELSRLQKVDPALHPDRRSAPNSGLCLSSLDCQDGVDLPPSPSPSPSPSLSSRTTSAQSLVDLWNEVVTHPIPKVSRLTTDRKTKIDARLRSYPDLKTWRTAILWINGQEWCRASGRGDHPNWTATLDWLVKNDGNVQRCLERQTVDVKAPAPTGPKPIDEAHRKYGNMRFGK